MQERGRRPEMKPGDWTCEECGASPNFASRTECYKCGAPRPDGSGYWGKPPSQERERWPSSRGGQEFKSGDWTCGECGASPVFASRNDCFRCGAPKPAGAGFNADRARPRGGGSSEFRQNFEGTRCFVENLSFEVDWRMLKDAFAEEGYPIVYASVSTERDSGRSKGHGIVQFETVHAAEHAIAEMTGYELDGRRINVRPDFQERNRRGGAGSAAGTRGGAGRLSRVDDYDDVDEDFGDEYDDERSLRGDARPGEWKDRTPAPPAGGAESWKSKEWSRVAGSGDAEGALDVNEEEVLDMLLRRDQAREKRDFGVADGILDELLGMGISLDDARRQRVWWVGRRADGKVNFRGAAAAPKRREWYTGGDAKGGDGGGGKGKGGGRGGWRGNDKFGNAW